MLPEYLSPELCEGLAEMKIETLFPVQSKVYPHVMAAYKGKVRYDVCITSPTGSGKTLGYALPIIGGLQGRTVKRLRALVMVPRKELATQVFQVFKTLCKTTNLTVQAVTGQDTLRVDQSRFSSNIPDILIATPSRLIEMLATISLESLRFLVLDEADLLLSDTTQDWLRVALAACGPDSANAPLHRVLCSATLTHNMAKLGQVSLVNPKQFMLHGNGEDLTDVKRYGIPSTLQESVMLCGDTAKLLCLRDILRKEDGTILVFTKTTDSAHRLARLLQLSGVVADEFSGQLTVKERAKVIQNLREGTSACAVCSDAFARGMDLDKVSLVINYEIPAFIQTYIHRVGRTARANRPGKALTLLEDEDEEAEFSLLHKKALSAAAPSQTAPPATTDDDAALMQTNLKKLQTVLRKEAKGTLKQTQPLPSDISTAPIAFRSKLLKRKRMESDEASESENEKEAEKEDSEEESSQETDE
eukprot:TRINITY_DN10184_c1_g3_i1.p1 TRINITY_DN10184_c1_g3~~TRINITY_DN10184_c1_g3_i1.p1  ORF type:complete len:494 (+),score=84.25 TRINITY_DN10184_c1_g3_i1:63-1484(+)